MDQFAKGAKLVLVNAVLLLSVAKACNIYIKKEGVAIETDRCHFQNVTDEIPQWACANMCNKDPQCKAAVTTSGSTSPWCCFLATQEILYQPGNDVIVYYGKNATIIECPDQLKLEGGCSECKKGPSWQAPDCDTCKPGLTGDNCHICSRGFGFKAPNCTTCLQNALWEGFEGDDPYWVRITFEGTDCNTVNAAESVANYNGGTRPIDNGSWNSNTGTLTWTQTNTWIYKGIVEEGGRNLTGTAFLPGPNRTNALVLYFKG